MTDDTAHTAAEAAPEGTPGGAPEGAASRTPFARRAAGVLIGCATAPAGLLLLAVGGLVLGPALLLPRTRARARARLAAGARRLTAVERWRRTAFFGDRYPAPERPLGDGPALRHLAARTGVGLVTGLVLLLLGFGAVLAAVLAAGVVRGSVGPVTVLGQAVVGGVLLFLNIQGLAALVAYDARLARECFGPSERERLRERIAELATSRAAVLSAVDSERRRIERDLHDGVQQRLVALAMLLGRARRRRAPDPEQADALLLQAHEEAQEILTELREVAWRVYPTALDTLGLKEALGGVAERCAVPLHIAYDLDEAAEGRLPAPVAAAAYFVVSEAVTNAAKHASATRIRVSVRRAGTATSGPAARSGPAVSGTEARHVPAVSGTEARNVPAVSGTEARNVPAVSGTEARNVPAAHAERRNTPPPHAKGRNSPAARTEGRKVPATYPDPGKVPAAHADPGKVPTPHAAPGKVPTPHAAPGKAPTPGTLLVRIEDDGVGGADPAGSGLAGLRGRVGALDGRLHVDSPLGGPTTITAEMPCA